MSLTPEEINELRAKKYNATVVGLQKCHSDLMIVRVRPDDGRPEHLPGQYCVLGLGNWEPRHPQCQEEMLDDKDESRVARRAYSLSCSILGESGDLYDDSNTDWVEFYIVLVRNTGKPQGPALTPRLFMLRENDRLFMGPKITGEFTLEPVQPTDNVIFLSTGTGEAPHNYMSWDLLRKGHKGKLLSVCCVRYRKDLGYLETHEKLQQQYENYAYFPLTTREAENATGKVYIQDLIPSGRLEEALGDELDPKRTHVFLCGNPAMIGAPEKDRETGEMVYPSPPAVIELLEQRGFQVDEPRKKIKGNIHFETYW